MSSVEKLIGTEDYKEAANSLYYAEFYAIRSILYFDNIDIERHRGVIAEYRRLIKKVIFYSEE